MGYGAHANNSIKSNRALLKKRRTFTEIKDSYIGYVADADLNFKELSLFEQKKIRDKIIAQAKEERKKQLWASLISVMIIAFAVFGIYLLFK